MEHNALKTYIVTYKPTRWQNQTQCNVQAYNEAHARKCMYDTYGSRVVILSVTLYESSSQVGK